MTLIAAIGSLVFSLTITTVKADVVKDVVGNSSAKLKWSFPVGCNGDPQDLIDRIEGEGYLSHVNIYPNARIAICDAVEFHGSSYAEIGKLIGERYKDCFEAYASSDKTYFHLHIHSDFLVTANITTKETIDYFPKDRDMVHTEGDTKTQQKLYCVINKTATYLPKWLHL